MYFIVKKMKKHYNTLNPRERSCMFVSEIALFETQTQISKIFDHSPQALLIAERTKIIYCNDAASEMLGIKPIGHSLIDYTDLKDASKWYAVGQEEQGPVRRRARFGEGYYDILTIPHGSSLYFFFYHPTSAHSVKQQLRDTARMLSAMVSQVRTNSPYATNDHLDQFDLLASETLALESPIMLPYDFFPLLCHAMQSYVDLIDRGILTFEFGPHQPQLIMPLNCKLLHSAFVGTVFDLLRLTKMEDPIAITLAHNDDSVSISYTCANTIFPRDLQSLLVSQDVYNPSAIMAQYGTYLYRAKRIFALHNGLLEIKSERRKGFSLSFTFPLDEHRPMLYSNDQQLFDLPTPLSLTSDLMYRLLGLDPEKP